MCSRRLLPLAAIKVRRWVRWGGRWRCVVAGARWVDSDDVKVAETASTSHSVIPYITLQRPPAGRRPPAGLVCPLRRPPPHRAAPARQMCPSVRPSACADEVLRMDRRSTRFGEKLQLLPVCSAAAGRSAARRIRSRCAPEPAQQASS